MRRWRAATAPTIFRWSKPPALASPISPNPRSPLERTRVWSTLISPRCSTRRVLRARISSRGEPLSRYHRHHGRDTHESQSGDGHGDLWPCSIHTSGPHSARLLLDVSLSSVLTVGLVFNAPGEERAQRREIGNDDRIGHERARNRRSRGARRDHAAR